MLSRLRTLLRRRSTERDLDDEMAYHLERLVDEHLAAGMEPAAARRAALKSFGGLEQAKEACRDARGGVFVEGVVRDVRQAARALTRTPGFTAVVILSLGLGVGANTAIYSLVDQVLLQPLPAKAPHQLVLLSWNGFFPGRWWGRTTDQDLLSYPLYQELTAENAGRLHVFSEVFARKPASVYLDAGTSPESVPVELVTGSFFRALGVAPALGRLLDETDDARPGEHPVVVLAHDFWKRRLGGAADIVGRKVVVNSQSATVVGVAAEGFRGMDPVEGVALWLPTAMQQQAGPEFGAMVGDRRAKWLHLFGRLAPGVTPAEARAALQPWFKTMLEADTRHTSWPTIGETARRRFLASTIEVSPASLGRSDQRGVLARPLQILVGASALVLLLACLNVANLLLARSFARRRDLALRSALGASSGRIARESCIQTGLLALGGVAAGVLATPAVTGMLVTFLPETVTLKTGVDLRIFLVALAIGVLTAALFGLAPALRAGRTRPAFALREQAGTVVGMRLRRALVVGQIALAMVLLVGASLFVRTLGGLRGRATYVTPDLLTFRVDLSKRGASPAQAKRKVIELLDALGGMPEVESAALSRLQLMSGGGFKMGYTIGPGVPIETDEVHTFMVSPGFFRTLGVPIVAGSDFRAPPQAADPEEYTVALVNQSFVRRYLPGRDPVGARLAFGARTGKAPRIEVIGVVADFPYSGLRAAEVQVFFPALEKALSGATFFARTRGPAPSVFASIRQVVRRVDPGLPVLGLRRVEDQVDSGLVPERVLATLATAFAAVAVLLAMLGLYGVMSFIVTRRTREIGIRLALGASRRATVGLVARETMALGGIGVAIGLSLVWAGGRLVESQLYGVRPLEPSILAGVMVFVALVAVAASALPALRATSVHPADALRVD